jgi:hypothetical protein
MWGLRFRFAAPPTEVARFERSGSKLTGTGRGTVEIAGGVGCQLSAELPFELRLPAACLRGAGGSREPSSERVRLPRARRHPS